MLYILEMMHDKQWGQTSQPEARVRARIAARSLFGVDAGSLPVAIAGLRLRLAVLAAVRPGETAPAATCNLGVGDSLLGIAGGDDGFAWRTRFAGVFAGSDPGFDVIIGNPPYVRQEAIARGGQTSVGYKASLEKIAAGLLPDFISKPGARLSARSDLQVHFFLLCPSLLKSGGVLSFISSDAWLDAEYGLTLRRFLAEVVSLRLVLFSGSSRSFAGAAVRTVITVLTRELAGRGAGARFVEAGMPLALLKPSTLLGAPPGAAGALRVRSVPTAQLAGQGGRPDKWGARFLRLAPSLGELPGLVPLPEIAALEYGSKPGIARFFIPPEGTLEAAGVEDRFLVPIISSTRVLHTFKLDGFGSGRRAFVCPDALANLERHGFAGAAAHVRAGASRTTARGAKHTVAGVPWPQAKSVQGNRPEWHCFKPREPGHFVVPCLLDKRLFFAWNPDSVPATNMFFQGRFREGISVRFGCGLLNCSIVYLMLEVFGRPKGLGGLNLYGPDLAEVLVPDPALFDPPARRRVEEAFDALCRRPILTIFEEVEMADRRHLDGLVCDALGVDRQLRELVSRELIRLAAQRLRLGRR